MLVKSYKKDNVELLMTKNDQDSYRVIRLVGGNESIATSELDEESAFDLFDYFLDKETGADE